MPTITKMVKRNKEVLQCTRRDDMEPLMNDTEEKTQNYSMTTIEMLHSSTFYLLFIALFCCSFYGNMYYNLYKVSAYLIIIKVRHFIVYHYCFILKKILR